MASIKRWRDMLALFIPLASMAWVLSVPQRLGVFVFPEQILAAILGVAMATVYLTAALDSHQQQTGPSTTAGNTIVRTRVALAVISVIVCGYLAYRIPVLSEEAFFRPVETLLIAALVIALVIDAVRRSVGYSLVIVLSIFVLYGLFGDLIPGPMQGRASSPAELLRFLGTDTTAMLGLPLSVTCFVVIMFVLFGRVLITTGGGDFFTGLSQALAGAGPGSSARVSIIASSLFGSVSGSAVANVMSTGVVTIPLMKRAGMPAHRAAAIESVASTGGQLMPPIMGAAAFLMAEFLQLPYREIVAAAFLPAVLYYLALFLQVDFIARAGAVHETTEPASSESQPRLSAVIREGWLLPIPFAILIVGLFNYNMAPEVAVLVALVALLALSFLRAKKAQRMTPVRIIGDLAATGVSVAPLVLVTAIAGMIIGILSHSGLSFSLGFVLLGFGEGNLVSLLLITAVVCIVLGMGLPTTGVYLLLATLAAPPLVELGLQPLQAHLFVLYFGMLSMITPPVALAAFSAASLAGAPQMLTGFTAMRYGWCAYMVPFLFIYHPALLMQGSAIDILLTMLQIVVALLLISSAIAGHAMMPLSRFGVVFALVVAGVLLLPRMVAGDVVQAVMLLIGIGAIVLHVWRGRSRRVHF